VICPFCGKDYRDVPKGKEPSGFYHGDDHFYMRSRRYGYRCGNCGEIAEVIARPTGERYLKRLLLTKQTDMFEADPFPTESGLGVTAMKNEKRK